MYINTLSVSVDTSYQHFGQRPRSIIMLSNQCTVGDSFVLYQGFNQLPKSCLGCLVILCDVLGLGFIRLLIYARNLYNIAISIIIQTFLDLLASLKISNNPGNETSTFNHPIGECCANTVQLLICL